MKENKKNTIVSSRLNDDQTDAMNKIVQEKGLKNLSQAIQYLINQHMILNSSK